MRVPTVEVLCATTESLNFALFLIKSQFLNFTHTVQIVNCKELRRRDIATKQASKEK